MRRVVRGVHLNVTDGLRQAVENKLARPLQRLFAYQEAVELDVQLVDTNGVTKGGLDKECRVTLHIPGMPSVHLEEASDDMYKSIALASDRLHHTANRYLHRQRDRQMQAMALQR